MILQNEDMVKVKTVVIILKILANLITKNWLLRRHRFLIKKILEISFTNPFLSLSILSSKNWL